MMMSGNGSCSTIPQVLGSSPLLVFEYEDVGAHHAAATKHILNDPDSTTSTTTGEDDDDAPSSFPTATGMLLYSLSERRIVYADGGMPEMKAAEDNACFSTPQGWVLVIGYGEATTEAWLWHPLAGDTVALPPIRDDHDIPINCKCLLTHASAAHPECAVVLLDVAGPVMWFCKVNGGRDRRSWGHVIVHVTVH